MKNIEAALSEAVEAAMAKIASLEKDLAELRWSRDDIKKERDHLKCVADVYIVAFFVAAAGLLVALSWSCE